MDYYKNKIRETLKFIESNLEEDLSLLALSERAGISKFHFHRIFCLHTGNTIHQVVLRYRLTNAAYKLFYETDHKVIDIVLNSGFESPESFSRAFKKLTGHTPTSFRKSPEWSCFAINVENQLSIENRTMNVEILELDSISLSGMRHTGSPSLLPTTLQKFVEWRRTNRLPPSKHRTFNLIYDDHRITPADSYQFDVCCQTNEEHKEDGILNITIPEGRYAKVRHIGAWDLLSDAIAFLYGQWLPISGERIADFPIIIERVNLYPEVPESELITDVYLPLL